MNISIHSLRRISIFNRLLIAFVIVIIIPNLTLSLILYFKHSTEVKDSVEAQVKQFVLSADQTIEIFLDDYESLLFENIYDDNMRLLLSQARLYEELYLHRDDAYANFLEHKVKIENRLYNFSPLDTKISSVQIVTPTQEFGQIDIYGNLRGGYFESVENFRATEAYNKAIEEDGYPIWIDLSNDGLNIKKQNTNYYLEPSIMLLRSLRDENGNHLGVIVVSISSSIFSDITISSELLDKGNLLLIGENRVIRSINENVKVPTLDDEVFGQVREGNYGWLDKFSEGEKLSVYYHSLEVEGWYIVYNILEDDLMESVNSTRQIVIIISFLVILIASVIAYFVTKSISIPLGNLKKVISNVDYNDDSSFASHDFLLRIGDEKYFKDDYKDEIAQLGISYNMMIKRLSELLLSLERSERQKEEEIILRKEAEIDALQMQINPHLLYNTLDIVRWEALRLEGEERTLSSMIMQLTQLLRLSIKRNQDLIPISEEIKHVKAYVEVVQYKFKDRFNVHFEIERPELINLGVVKLVLQPLVENSILYGQKAEVESIDVFIRVYTINEDVFFEVEDNGAGIHKERLNEIRHKLKTNESNDDFLALKNIHDRIKLNFGEKYGLEVLSKYDQGTTVRICIPKISLE